MSHGRPAKCVGRIARVRGPMRAATAARSRLRVPGSTSTNTGVAPTLTIMFGAAKNVIAGVMTSSPGPMPHTVQRQFQRGGRRRHAAHVAGRRHTPTARPRTP